MSSLYFFYIFLYIFPSPPETDPSYRPILVITIKLVGFFCRSKGIILKLDDQLLQLY